MSAHSSPWSYIFLFRLGVVASLRGIIPMHEPSSRRRFSPQSFLKKPQQHRRDGAVGLLVDAATRGVVVRQREPMVARSRNQQRLDIGILLLQGGNESL